MAIPRVFVVGATGAQGLPVCRGLVKDGGYSLRILTRDATSHRAKEILALRDDTEVIEGSFTSEADLRNGFRGCWGAFVNIDGFNCGEKGELFWGIRSYELAIEEGVKFFVWGNLEYTYKKSGYNPAVRAGHVDGKGRIGEWIRFQNQDNRERMGAAIFTTGPYIEMNFSARTVMAPRIVDGVVTWAVPIGTGTAPMVALDDCDHYVRWLFDNHERSNGMDLQVAIDHLNWDDLTEAFTKVTGKPARWINVPIDQYFSYFPISVDGPAGHNADPHDPANMSFRDNFTGFWSIFHNIRKDNTGIMTRDYELLDKIHPNRIRTAEEWMRSQDEQLKRNGEGGLWESLQEGKMKMVLKTEEDGRRGRS